MLLALQDTDTHLQTQDLTEIYRQTQKMLFGGTGSLAFATQNGPWASELVRDERGTQNGDQM